MIKETEKLDKHEINQLRNIAEKLKTQDNRCTCNPMFCLQIKVRDRGYDPEYSEDTIWIDMESGDYQEVEPNTEGAEEVGYKDRWETVMVAFTEQGLLGYMEKDGHNIVRRAYNGEVRLFVESFSRCAEMILIRKLLMSDMFEQMLKTAESTMEVK